MRMLHEKILELSSVGLRYTLRSGGVKNNEYWALKNISFSIYSGECLGVIGRNGVGKSSLLKVISGILQPDRGEVIRHHDVISSLLTLQLGFSSNLTGRENALLSGMLLGLSKKEVEGKIQEIIDFSELGQFFEAPLSTYSSGMKARLGFAVSMLSRPDLLLIDEVLGVGDAQFRRKSNQAIKECIKSDKTVVLVSHSLSTIKELCNRVVWIENGETIMQGEAKEVLGKYDVYNQLIASIAKKKGISEMECRNSMASHPLDFIREFALSMAESRS
jgi:lipopolysaccharide transport system ATP-binding protein